MGPKGRPPKGPRNESLSGWARPAWFLRRTGKGVSPDRLRGRGGKADTGSPRGLGSRQGLWGWKEGRL